MRAESSFDVPPRQILVRFAPHHDPRVAVYSETTGGRVTPL